MKLKLTVLIFVTDESLVATWGGQQGGLGVIAVQSQTDGAGLQVTFNHGKVLCSPLRDTIAWPLLGLVTSLPAKLSLPSRAARVGLPGTNWSVNSNVILKGTAQKGPLTTDDPECIVSLISNLVFFFFFKQ